MTALYVIANEMAGLTNNPDLTPEMIADTLEGIEWAMEKKVEQCLAVCKNEQALADALREESKKLLYRAMAAENRAERIKEYVASSMATAGVDKITAGIHQVTIRKPSLSVEITDAGSLPPELVDYDTVAKPDKLGIRKLIEAGKEVPGAVLKTGKASLIIK